jgi:hypothetical protein
MPRGRDELVRDVEKKLLAERSQRSARVAERADDARVWSGLARCSETSDEAPGLLTLID